MENYAKAHCRVSTIAPIFREKFPFIKELSDKKRQLEKQEKILQRGMDF